MDKTKLYQKAMELAKAADFEFWEGELWAPQLQCIDWSCDYDDQLVELVRLTVLTCSQYVGDRDSLAVKKLFQDFGLNK